MTTLYHQTSKDSVEKIIKNGMKLGTNGIVGGAIYFADNISNTFHKAQHHGAILQCEVELGKLLNVGDNYNNYNQRILNKQGFDSILVPRRGGSEFVVFDMYYLSHFI